MLEDLRIDAARLSRELDTLARFSDEPAPAVTRVVYTPTDLEARAYLRTLLLEAGLELREDALGNLFARWAGERPDLAAVATGSHIDAIPHAGRYDGTVGVLGALEVFRALRAAGFVPMRPLELLLFTSEEPTRFGVGCLGSRALAGTLDPEALAALHDENGVGVLEAARGAGFTGRLEDVALPDGHFHAFVELHIEQGPLLEAAGVPIGVVTAIAAPATLHVTLTGSGGHAGSVLMRGRRDALLTGAEVALGVEAAALASGDPDTVATVGVLDVHPRAVNAVPSRVFLTIDARDTLEARRDAVVSRVRSRIDEVAARRGVSAEVEVINADPPAACDPALVAAVERAVQGAGLESLRLVSRAYHDTLFMARVCPVGMIFIPSKGGVSHRPDEYSSPQEVARGVTVLAQTLAALASDVPSAT